jgi:tRNA-dihydrouridine synthase A
MNPAETRSAETPTEIGISDDFPRGKLDRRISVAPMMDWTDRHCRYFLRGFSPDVLLYTEMITTGAILRGKRERLLAYDAAEHPLALQLGGSEPAALAAAARIGADLGYDEINLNCGCPSDRVHSGAFGACLMLEPARVADCVAAMHAAVSIPVTVKMRIGVVAGHGADLRGAIAEYTEADAQALLGFVAQVRAAGVAAVIVHSRKAVLGGLSPKENREVPPLRYDVVRAVKERFPMLPVVLNGGLRQVDRVLAALSWCDGVMLGREAYHRPWLLKELHAALGGGTVGGAPDRVAMLARMADYAARELARGERLPSITRHMLGLYAGEPGAREYRRLLSAGARDAGVGADLLSRATPNLATPRAAAAVPAAE